MPYKIPIEQKFKPAFNVLFLISYSNFDLNGKFINQFNKFISLIINGFLYQNTPLSKI